jgi:hypothetical protein
MDRHRPAITDDQPLVIRASPRLLAPDWADRLRYAPAPAILLIAVVIALVATRSGGLTSWVVAVIVVMALVAGPYLAKAANSRVTVGQTYVESRDAFRRSVRVDRQSLAAMYNVRHEILGPGFSLTKVVIADRDGWPRLNLSWDSYSDADLARVRDALSL